MKNYKAVVVYDGTRYGGWQRQKNTENTIQGILEETISAVLEQKIEIHGSGRTDAGVHAYGQVISFKSAIVDLTAVQMQINEKLPEDIRIHSLEETDREFHSRYSAVSKEYVYRIDTGERPSVFSRSYTWHISEPLDLNKMRGAASFLSGKHNFRGFSVEKDKSKSTTRTLEYVKIEKVGDEIQFYVKGNGFLHHMVRIIVGTMVEVGSGERKVESVQRILDTKQRAHAGQIAPAKGLFLNKVEYKN